MDAQLKDDLGECCKVLEQLKDHYTFSLGSSCTATVTHRNSLRSIAGKYVTMTSNAVGIAWPLTMALRVITYVAVELQFKNRT